LAARDRTKPGQPGEADEASHVAGFQFVEKPAQFRTVGASAAGFLTKDFSVPAACSSLTCAATLCPSVDTRA
jgi:hypothetical protein